MKFTVLKMVILICEIKKLYIFFRDVEIQLPKQIYFNAFKSVSFDSFQFFLINSLKHITLCLLIDVYI